MPETQTLVGKHLLISGRVQGVNYRYSMRQVARELGLTGWCRNLPNGQVEAHVYGLPEAVEKLIAWCHSGPPHAQVVDVVVADLPVSAQTLPQTFDIVR